MKFTFLFILLASFFAAYAQQATVLIPLEDKRFDAEFIKRTIPEITGKIINITPEELKKTRVSYTIVTLAGQVSKTAGVASDGSFRLKLDFPLPYQQIWLAVGDFFYTGIYADKNLDIEIDVKKIKSKGTELAFNGEGVKYTGAGSQLNIFMNDYVLFRRDEKQALNRRQYSVARPQQALTAADFKSLNGIFDSLKMIQDDYTKKHPSPYAALLENDRMSEYYSLICLSYFGMPMPEDLFEKVKSHQTFHISNNSELYYRYLSYHLGHYTNDVTVSWEDVALLPDLDAKEKAVLDSLREISGKPGNAEQTIQQMSAWTKQLTARLNQVRQQKRAVSSIALYDSIFASSPKADLLKAKLNDPKDIAEQKELLEKILPAIRTEWCRKITKADYDNAVAKLQEINNALAASANTASTGFGKPVMQTDFGASLYTVSNMKVADFLAGLKKTFNGKAIIFDLWATWCLPCINQMPHSKDLQQQSKDLPVAFVYVCTESGSDEEKWKRKVFELQQPGIHFFIDDALDGEIREYFSFSGYPGYAFIDRNGVYKPGAISWLSEIKGKEELADLVNAN